MLRSNLIYLLIISLSGCLTSCKTEVLLQELDTRLAQHNAFAQYEFMHIQTMLDTEAQCLNQNPKPNTETFCPEAVVSSDLVDGTIWRISIDFGDSCQCADGRIRSGRLVGFLQGDWEQAGARITVRPGNYAVIDLEGVKHTLDVYEMQTRYEGLANGQFPSYFMQVDVGTVGFGNDQLSWSCAQRVIWLIGFDDIDPLNNAYLLDGSIEGRHSAAGSYSGELTEPIRIGYDCPYIRSGSIRHLPQLGQELILEFGESCTDQAQLVGEDEEKTVALGF